MLKRMVLNLAVVMLVMAAIVPSLALAQEGDEDAGPPPHPLVLFTSYPTREASAGKTVTFNFTLLTETEPQIVRLETKGLPSAWSASFRGGGEVVRSVYVRPGKEETVSLRVELPDGVASSTYGFTVVATSEVASAEFPLELVVAETTPASLAWEVELPTLKGKPTTTFRYDAKLRNDGGEDLTVNLIYEAPPRFGVTFKLLGQEVSSIPLPVGESKSIDVDVDVPDDQAPGLYELTIRAQGADVSAETTLVADVTENPGKPSLSISGADGRLSGDAYAGKETALKVVVRNTGDAAAKNVKMSSSEPSGWKVRFDPQEIPEIPKGEQVEVTAYIAPAEKAVAGDYMVTVRALPEKESSKSVDFRITVRTSTLWGVVGVVIIAVAVGVVALAVMRFGRR
ncbi:MAG: COG1470 family protein [Anaerolineae bacterium]